jgi:outer membrane lipoprotein-sorting protein
MTHASPRANIGSMRTPLLLACLLLTAAASARPEAPEGEAAAPNAREIVRRAMDHWRGTTSWSDMTMVIHRPDWERRMSMRGWSRGDNQSLVRVTEPAKDAGNATLLDGNDMWTFSPRVNRVIKVPSSMMGQSWMGSDFSNRDVSKSTEILEDYDHTLDAVTQEDDHTVYTISAIPHEDAPVVWGRQVLRVRDDWVLLEEQYWDQDGRLVKSLETTDVAEMGGRTVARVMRMGKIDAPEEWTEMIVNEIEFDVDLPANVFTLANLRNPRR